MDNHHVDVARARCPPLCPCRLNYAHGAQHFLSSDMHILLSGTMAGSVLPPGVPYPLSCPYGTLHPSALAGPNPHAVLSPDVSFNKDREQVDILETSQEVSGCFPSPKQENLCTRFIEEEPYLLTMLSASTTGSGGSDVLHIVRTSFMVS